MVKTITKRIFGNNAGFRVKEDPNDWNASDVDHMARCIIRASKKHPIKLVQLRGAGHRRCVENRVAFKDGGKWGNAPENWNQFDANGRYLEFEIQVETKCPRQSRKTCMEDIRMMLIMEVL